MLRFFVDPVDAGGVRVIRPVRDHSGEGRESGAFRGSVVNREIVLHHPGIDRLAEARAERPGEIAGAPLHPDEPEEEVQAPDQEAGIGAALEEERLAGR